MLVELRNLGVNVQKQFPVNFFYEEEVVGDCFADLWLEESVIVELKATPDICGQHECQRINYLKTSGLEIGLLLNFENKPQC